MTASFDKLYLDAQSRQLVDPHRLSPLLIEGMTTDVKEIGPQEAISDKKGGRYEGMVKWYDTLYVGVAPPDDDATYPQDTDWRIASSLHFPLLSAAYLNATLRLGLPPLSAILYLGGDTAALDGLSGPELRPGWDSALLHGVARFVAGHSIDESEDGKGSSGGGRKRRRKDSSSGGGGSKEGHSQTLAAAGHLFLGREYPKPPKPAEGGGAIGALAEDSEADDADITNSSELLPSSPSQPAPQAAQGNSNSNSNRKGGDEDANRRKFKRAPPGSIRFMTVGEDAVHRIRDTPSRVCARRAVFLGQKPLLLGGPAEANAWMLAASRHIFPKSGLRFPYPSAAERKHRPLKVLIWDAGRIANLAPLLAVVRKYVPSGAIGDITALTSEEAEAMAAGQLAAVVNGHNILVTSAGEGFVHSLFLPPRSTIILVHPYQLWSPLHQRIGTIAGHNVLPIFSRLPGPGRSYGSTGTLTPDECEAMGYVEAATTPCAGAYRKAKVVVPLATFESTLIDAIALAGPVRFQHTDSPLDSLEGAPPSGMPIPPYYDFTYGQRISEAYCSGHCKPLSSTGNGIAPGPDSASRDALPPESDVAAVLGGEVRTRDANNVNGVSAAAGDGKRHGRVRKGASGGGRAPNVKAGRGGGAKGPKR